MAYARCTKLQRLQARERPKQIAQGWTLDESRDVMIPPGSVRAPE